jgi:phosphoglycolate phosphatase-like HAD superfamily hydrolase
MRLVLFDIDGTLVWADGAGRAAMEAALLRVYGTGGSIESYDLGGRTIKEIVRDLMSEAGLPPEVIWAEFDEYCDALTDDFQQRVQGNRHNIQPCPGAIKLVSTLATRNDIVVGLLTGNLPTVSMLKLGAAGFDVNWFKVGSYGDRSDIRSDLLPLALEQATVLTGVHFTGKRVVIVGDTAIDIACGAGIGARSIGVLTGEGTQDELLSANADYIFSDLTDTQAVLKAIYAPVPGG